MSSFYSFLVSIRRVLGQIRILWLQLIHQNQVLNVIGIRTGFISRNKKFKNRENLTDFNFYLPYNSERIGISAILRVKNEQQKILYCLASILDVFDEIVFIDNASTDKTLELTLQFKERYDADGKIKVYSYPHAISRCGSEHLATSQNSVHSLAYYYNYSLSHCSFKYACKWDADMVLLKEKKEKFRSFLMDKVLPSKGRVWLLKGQTVYRDLNNNYFVSSSVNSKPRIFPFTYLNHYVKSQATEILLCKPPLIEDYFLEDTIFYELKFSSEDEFSHCSPELLTDSENSLMDGRGRAEFKALTLVRKGQANLSSLLPISSEFLSSP